VTPQARHFTRRVAALLAVVAALAGCAGLAPGSQDSEAKEFRPLLDKGVIYLVRG